MAPPRDGAKDFNDLRRADGMVDIEAVRRALEAAKEPPKPPAPPPKARDDGLPAKTASSSSNMVDIEAVRRSRDAVKDVRKKGAGGPGAGGPSDRSEVNGVIRYEGGRLAENVAEADRALADYTLRHPHRGVYQRGPILVRVLLVGELFGPASHGGSVHRDKTSLVISPVSDAFLKTRLSEAARIEKYNVRQGLWCAINPPLDLVKGVQDAGEWQTPPLLGVITAPTIRLDGSVLDEPGYDAKTGLLYDPGNTTFPKIKEQPDRDDIAAALEVIREPLAEFPFIDLAAEAVAIAAIITGLVRRSLRTAPLFGFSAPTPASGKSLLASLPALISAGASPHVTPLPDTPVDERKTLFSALLENPISIVLDNVERPLKSETLCVVLTEPTISDRLLGASKFVSVPTNVLLCATGNNMQIVGDMATRALMCRIVPLCEHPGERKFEINLRRWVIQHRPSVVAAALTLIKGYLAAGSPPVGAPPFGRFEEWDALVRWPLIYAGAADPLNTQRALIREDDKKKNTRALLAAWHAAVSDQAVKLKTVIGKQDAELQEALLPFKNKRGEIDISYWARNNKDCVCDGLQLQQVDLHQRAAVWRVVRV